ncbi:TetR family transcriptional regulator C-terminal domain-containing protein [Fulvivirgaceae bacterium BMA10]|uniref:TetR family transcriptional regulator C-terminal domain-containing protein n=1 Tax=Splendidivirga corallicola TaxID=3051826 RepID=A0ABT8KVR2_9BACT|nr:TetR family transcriptional regulator C-terminal domain-containing protein [Fulvivirgaceae bacterium BMA10]
MKEDNINRILDLGIEIMNRKGYHHLGLKELLDEAGIPKGSFYYYFKSKEDFGEKVIAHYANNILKYMSSVLSDKSKGPGERLISMFQNNEKVYESSGFKEGCLMGKCSNELAGQYDSMQLLMDQKFSSWKGVISQCIKEGQEMGEFRSDLSADDLADFILNNWEGALIRMKATRSVKPYTLFVDYTMNVILKA